MHRTPLGYEPIEDCHWARAAASAQPFPPLSATVEADVGIIGAGYTGLVAALTAAQGGARVAVLEARQPGWAASGRNAGQVVPMMWGMKKTPAQISKQFGPERGRRMNEMIAGSGKFLFSLIEQHQISCDARSQGYLCVARSDASWRKLCAYFEQWRPFGGQFQPVPKSELSRFVVSPRYAGGVFLPEAGTLNPLAFSRGLAAAATRSGVRIFGDSPAETVMHASDGWTIATRNGTLKCTTLLVGTGAYVDDLFPALKDESYPLVCGVIATDPLPETARSALAGGVAIADLDDPAVFGPAIDAQGCLVVSFMIESTQLDLAHALRITRPRLARSLPQLKDVEFTRIWAGKFLITADGLPRVLRLGPNAYSARGCNGLGHTLGIAAAHDMGKRALGAPESELVLPVTEPKRAPLAGVVPGLLRRAVFPLVNRLGA